MISLRKKTVLLSIILILVFFSLLQLSAQGKTEKEEDLEKMTVGFHVDMARVDLHQTTHLADRQIMFHVYEPLIGLDKNRDPVGVLANSWDISPDGVKYTFNLRQGVLFHNGEELTANDVKYSIERYMSKGIRSEELNQRIKSIDVIDKYTLEIELYEKFAPFISDLGNDVAPLVIIPNGNDFQEVIGTGPYVLDEWDPGNFVKLIAFEDYVVDERPANGFSGEKIAHIKEIIFRVIPEASTRAMALQTGEIDLATELRIEDYELLKDIDGIIAKSWPGVYYMNIRIGSNVNPFDVNLRRAVAHAYDRETALIAITQGYGDILTSLVPKNSAWYSDVHDSYYRDYDLDKAREYLAKSDYNGETLNIVTLAGNAPNIEHATILKDFLSKIGIETEIDIRDTAAWGEAAWTGEHDFFLHGSIYPPEPHIFYSLRDHHANWDNPEYFAIHDQAAKTLDFDKRKELYEELHKIAVDEAPFLQPIARTNQAAMSESIKGLNLGDSPAAYYRLWNVWKE